MPHTNEQQHQIARIIDYRDQISNSIFHIERILKQHFPDEYNIAYQHWIPQIVTALYHDKKWLPRGQQTLQNTLNRLLDTNSSENKTGQTVKKFI